jgi:hypothetical protein
METLKNVDSRLDHYAIDEQVSEYWAKIFGIVDYILLFVYQCVNIGGLVLLMLQNKE